MIALYKVNEKYQISTFLPFSSSNSDSNPNLVNQKINTDVTTAFNIQKKLRVKLKIKFY